MKIIALIALLVVAANAQPPRPDFPTQFASKYKVTLTFTRDNTTETFQADGDWYIDEPRGTGLEKYKVEGYPQYDRNFLERYDLGKEYEIDKFNNSVCHERNVTGSFPDVWGWVQNATFAGTKLINNYMVDWWVVENARSSIAVGVLPSAANSPLFFERSVQVPGANRDILYEFHKFTPGEPHHGYFNIPSVCRHQQSEVRAKNIRVL